MPISTYEGISAMLTSAGEEATNKLAMALKDLHSSVIADPNNIIKAKQKWDASINVIAQDWEKEWRTWADQDLANACQTGIADMDQTLKGSGVGLNINPVDADIKNIFPGASPGAASMFSIPTEVIQAFEQYNSLYFSTYSTWRNKAYNALLPTRLSLIRRADDIYRKVAIETGELFYKEADVFTRRAFSQAMLDKFAASGIDNIVYKNGRRVSLEAYSEMVGRTMTGQAAIESSMLRCQEMGHDLVRVTSHAGACELCLPFQGKVYSLSGTNKKYPSLQVAISGGLFHPDCVHDTSLFFPGLSPEELENKGGDAEVQGIMDKQGLSKSEAQEYGYKARQQQRYNERNIRQWKKKELTALDDTTKAQAHSKVLEWQAKQRSHIETNDFLRRNYAREGIGKIKTVVPKVATPSGAAKGIVKPIENSILKAEKEIRDITTHETAYVFDSKGKVLIKRNGIQGEVEFTPADDNLLKGNLLTHNHPDGRAFSDNDMVFMHSREIREMHAVTPKYRYTAKPTGKLADPSEIRAAYKEARVKYQDEFLELLDEGKITKLQAREEISNRIWTEISDKYKISYKRETWEEIAQKMKPEINKMVANIKMKATISDAKAITKTTETLATKPAAAVRDLSTIDRKAFKEVAEDSKDLIEHTKFIKSGGLSEDETIALSRYTDTSYLEINSYLRSDGLESITPRNLQSIPIMKNAIKKAPALTENEMFYRSMNKYGTMEKMYNIEIQKLVDSTLNYASSDEIMEASYQILKKKLTGSSFIDKGFASTSRKVYGSNDIELIIHAQKGFKNGVMIESISSFKSEAEYLLNAGQRYQVFDIELNREKKRLFLHIFVE